MQIELLSIQRKGALLAPVDEKVQRHCVKQTVKHGGSGVGI